MVDNGAWWTFFAGSLSCFLTGATYTLGLFSPALKEVFGYSQIDIGSLALAKDIGNFIVMDSGIITSRFGPHWTLGFGSLGMALSALGIWAALQSDGNIPFIVMILLCWLFGHSLGYADNAGISTSVKNFPKHKGSAVGLMKSLEGITGAVLSSVFFTLFDKNDLANFPLLLVICAVLVGVVATPVMKLTNKPAEEPDDIVALKFRILVLCLLGYIIYCALIGFTKTYTVFTTVLAVVPLPALMLLVLPFGAQDRASCKKVDTVTATAENERPNLSSFEMLKGIDFYLIWISLIILQGSGIMFANNMGQIVMAEKEDPNATAGMLLTIFSVFNGAGRILAGFGSESLKGHINRPWFLCMSSLIMTLCMMLLPAFQSMLPVAAGLVGGSMGATFALQAVVMEEVFGPKQMPIKYSYCYTAACLGSLIFSDLLAGKVYDAEAERQGVETCLGSSCFGTTFYVTAACNCVALLCTVMLSIRSRQTYVLVNGCISTATESKANGFDDAAKSPVESCSSSLESTCQTSIAA